MKRKERWNIDGKLTLGILLILIIVIGKLSRILHVITFHLNSLVRPYFYNHSGDRDLPSGNGGFGT